MDMSLKLNLSYQATRQAEQVTEKPVARPTEISEEGKKDEPLKVQGVDDVKNAVAEIEKFLNETRRNTSSLLMRNPAKSWSRSLPATVAS